MSSSGWLCSQSNKRKNKVTKNVKTRPSLIISEAPSKSFLFRQLNLRQKSIKEYCKILDDQRCSKSSTMAHETRTTDLLTKEGTIINAIPNKLSETYMYNAMESGSIDHGEATKLSDTVDMEDHNQVPGNGPRNDMVIDDLNDNVGVSTLDIGSNLASSEADELSTNTSEPIRSNFNLQNPTKNYTTSGLLYGIENGFQPKSPSPTAHQLQGGLPNNQSDSNFLTFDTQEPLRPFVALPMFSEFTLSSQNK